MESATPPPGGSGVEHDVSGEKAKRELVEVLERGEVELDRTVGLGEKTRRDVDVLLLVRAPGLDTPHLTSLRAIQKLDPGSECSQESL